MLELIETKNLTPKAHAVAHAFKRRKFDKYAEEPWASRLLFEVESFHGAIHDPFVGRGHIVTWARRAGFKITGSDFEPPLLPGRTRPRFPVREFRSDYRTYDNIVT